MAVSLVPYPNAKFPFKVFQIWHYISSSMSLFTVLKVLAGRYIDKVLCTLFKKLGVK